MQWALDNANTMQPKSFVEKAQVVVARRRRRWIAIDLGAFGSGLTGFSGI
jgi:hypothetical protein